MFSFHSLSTKSSGVTSRFCDPLSVSLQFRWWQWRRRILQALTNTSYPLAPGLLTLSAIRLTWRSIARSMLREGTAVISMKEHEETGKTRRRALCSALNFVRLIIPRKDQETYDGFREIR